MNFWKKKITDTTSVANKLNVDEQKIKELKEGKRQVSGETLQKVLDAVDETKMKEQIENMEIMQWYRNTDLVALRKMFGYEKQIQLARRMNEDQGHFNRFETKKFKEINRIIKKMYYFYNNQFNINVDEINEKFPKKDEHKTLKPIKKTKIKISKYINDDIDTNEILKWYNATDIKALRQNNFKNKTMCQVAKMMGLADSTYGTYEMHRPQKKISGSLIKMYKFFDKKGLVHQENQPIQLSLDTESIVIDQSKNDIINEVNKNIYQTKIEHLTSVINQQNILIERYEKIIDKLTK